MGWTADDDPIADVELKFQLPQRGDQIRERQEINYRVQDQRHASESVPQHDERERNTVME
jgi:hypothetical protein